MKKMMKSLAFNAIILYLLFKTPVSELILARLTPYTTYTWMIWYRLRDLHRKLAKF